MWNLSVVLDDIARVIHCLPGVGLCEQTQAVQPALPDSCHVLSGGSLPYAMYLDLRPGSQGGHQVTRDFHARSLSHSAKFGHFVVTEVSARRISPKSIVKKAIYAELITVY